MGTDTGQAGSREGTRPKEVIENSVELKRPAVEVFDYSSDLRNELEWNPKEMRSVELLTPEPVQAGSSYRARWKGGPAMSIEYVEFDRPHRWVAIANSSFWHMRFTGTVEETGDGCRLTARMEITPRGLGRLFFPVLVRGLRRDEQNNMALIKRAVEA